ncbi:MAG: L-serine ammonia-lyase, iron-sulfur-dependent subunit beta [Hespellia sp.]|nr:L-serine ammonia-lyase, iron-sulfur-dependent subunit beta [Hespellia sp.]
MDYIGIFDAIGPNMIGPSSSHTAGAVSMALLARKLFGRPIQKVTFTLYGSFAMTYKGHGTDKALLGGTLGFATDDERIRDAFAIAEQRGILYEFIIDGKTQTEHPNTADIVMESADGYIQSVRGESTGGGKVKIVRINNIDVEFTGEYSTLIVRQTDKPGIVAHITQCLANQDVNIAFMRLFREDKGAAAYTVVESDEKIPESVLDEMKSNPNVHELMLIEV